jgi:TrkA domain protein
MAEVRQTPLPGVGVRHEFTTGSGSRLGVIAYRDGRREVLVYDRDDPDVCLTAMRLSADDARTLVEVLGGSKVSEVLTAVQHEIAGLGIEWVTIAASSGFDGRTIGDGQIRTRTGVSIVAVIRGAETVAAPGPDFQLRGGDVVVAIGTGSGLAQARSILEA